MNKGQATETAIDRHMIGGHGPLLEFIEQSQRYGVRGWGVDDSLQALKKAARLEDKGSRELILSLIDKLEQMREDSDELRKRFETTHKALVKINDNLKSE
jgi:hypothetical protein